MPPERPQRPKLPKADTEIYSILVERRCPACDHEVGTKGPQILPGNAECSFCLDTGLIQDRVSLLDVDKAIARAKGKAGT